MLSRAQFECACQGFARRYPQWSWVVGHRPGYGYLTRPTAHTYRSPLDLEDAESMFDLEVEEDIATAETTAPSLNVQEYIVYSASFMVPAFYFTMSDSTGAPLPLHNILDTSLFKVKPPCGSEATTFALTLPSGSFPLLSQGDHPTLGTPCWYFHPCETDAAVGEFMADAEQPNWSEEVHFTRWLELWLMIVGSILNL